MREIDVVSDIVREFEIIEKNKGFTLNKSSGQQVKLFTNLLFSNNLYFFDYIIDRLAASSNSQESTLDDFAYSKSNSLYITQQDLNEFLLRFPKRLFKHKHCFRLKTLLKNICNKDKFEVSEFLFSHSLVKSKRLLTKNRKRNEKINPYSPLVAYDNHYISITTDISAFNQTGFTNSYSTTPIILIENPNLKENSQAWLILRREIDKRVFIELFIELRYDKDNYLPKLEVNSLLTDFLQSAFIILSIGLVNPTSNKLITLEETYIRDYTTRFFHRPSCASLHLSLYSQSPGEITLSEALESVENEFMLLKEAQNSFPLLKQSFFASLLRIKPEAYFDIKTLLSL